MKAKLKFTVILIVEFAAIALLLLLVFFAGKKSYDVTFDLNGGTLISGDIDQRITQGQNATPPTVVKEGHYLHGWSGSYKSVTSDRVIKAIWEYETSPGIEYSDGKNQTYCEIVGCYPDVAGDIYIGAYNDEKTVLGITAGAFAGCDRITAVHLLDGILRIDGSAFEDCTDLETIDIPSTVRKLGERVFANCVSLVNIVLPEGLEEIGAEAFWGCESLETITIPSTVKAISEGAFEGCKNLKEVIFAAAVEKADSETADKDNGEPGGKTAEPEPIITPSSVTVIEKAAFKDCVSLTDIALPEMLEEIGEQAFSGCTDLEKIVIPWTVKVIGSGAFDTAGLTVYTSIKENEMPEGWTNGWSAEVNTVWEYVDEED